MADLTYDEMAGMVGQMLGTSDWQDVTHEKVNAFANATGDHQWIHVDVERANRESPFGGPIAHGYLTLSMLSAMAMEIGVLPKGTAAALNYGLDKVRFLVPVPVGAKLRLHSKLISLDPKRRGRFLLTTENTMEIQGTEKPAVIAESLALLIPAPDA
jgi:acyl dehydratase